MSVARFPSLMNGNTVYTVHSSSTDLWDQCYHAHAHLGYYFGRFDTYGDGMVQHGPEVSVPQMFFGDFCASLAAHLLVHFAEDGFITGSWPQASNSETRKRLDFAFSLRAPVHNDEGTWKDKYYSLELRKVTTNREKQHDKRWEKVPDWADGSVEAAYRILLPDFNVGSLIEQYHLYRQCWEYGHMVLEQYGSADNPETYFSMGEGGDWAARAFDAAQAAVDACCSRHLADRLLKNWRQNVLPKTTEEVA
jgi:hypothetical protein